MFHYYYFTPHSVRKSTKHCGFLSTDRIRIFPQGQLVKNLQQRNRLRYASSFQCVWVWIRSATTIIIPTTCRCSDYNHFVHSPSGHINNGGNLFETTLIFLLQAITCSILMGLSNRHTGDCFIFYKPFYRLQLNVVSHSLRLYGACNFCKSEKVRCKPLWATGRSDSAGICIWSISKIDQIDARDRYHFGLKA